MSPVAPEAGTGQPPGTLGVVMLVHTALYRAEQLARHWTAAGCPVVLHVDRNVSQETYLEFRAALEDNPLIRFSRRYRCEWGTWGIVSASQAASELMLEAFPDVRHVYLASGFCVPLRPVAELVDYLAERPETDFIESATTADVPWIVDGLSEERFTLSFPFSWKQQRFLFDQFVALQRLLRIKRRMPGELKPHMGSQWWCLTRETLLALLQDPRRRRFDAFFKRVWIPDESYYQTLVRQYSRKIESRSLTLSKFDYQGKPHIFYDDHLQLLRRSDCFVARKIWPQADRLYDAFLGAPQQGSHRTEPSPGKIDRIFSKAVERRTRGRAGLYMQSRLPRVGVETGITCSGYSVFQGFADLFEDFEPWLAQATGTRVHGHLFHPKRAEFGANATLVNGCLSDSAPVRDYNPEAFLSSLLWNMRGERQCFQFGPGDAQRVMGFMARDPNAQISVISGAWIVPLFKSKGNFEELRREAARLQRIEAEQLKTLRAYWVKARVRIWTMAEFVEAPMENLQAVLDEISTAGARFPGQAPRMTDLEGFGQFLQNLKNQGMHPYLMGDFPLHDPLGEAGQSPMPVRKPYLVK